MAAPPTRHHVMERVRAIVTAIAGPHRTPVEVGPATALIEGFWLDSIALLEVVIACEEEFGITFDSDADLTADALRTIESLVDVILTRVAVTRAT